MPGDRNLIVRTDNEATAIRVYDDVKSCPPEFRQLCRYLSEGFGPSDVAGSIRDSDF
jgi:hypothetical protein